MATTTFVEEQTRKSLKRIADLAVAGDYEGAHAEEDQMRQRVLAHVASLKLGAGVEGFYVSRDLAQLAASSRRIRFPRHCA